MPKTVNELLVAQGGLRIPGGAAAGEVAVADAAGNVSWQNLPGTGLLSGWWYVSQGQGAQTAHAATFAAGTITAYPLSIRKAVAFDALGYRPLALQAGATLLGGLYADNGSGYPGALIAGTNVSFAISVGGGNIVSTFTPATAAPPLVWIVGLNTGASASLNTLTANTTAFDAMPVADPLNNFNFNPSPGFVVTGTGFSAMPATFPAVASGTIGAPINMYVRAH